jgi:hypothetical protein
VTVTSPLAAAVNVAIDSVITVTFSADMASETINADTIVVKQGSTLIAAAVTYASKIASIAPSSLLAYGTPYTVKVTTSVRDSAGTAIAKAVEFSFTTAIHSSAWAGNLAIENLSGPCDKPEIAASADGSAICVFLCGNDAYAVRYNGTSWGTPVSLKSGSDNCYYPKVAMDQNGNAIAVWMQDDATHKGVFASNYTQASGTWTAPASVVELDEDLAPGHDAMMPDVAYGSSGTEAMVIWAQFTGSWTYILAKRYTSTWSALATASGVGVMMAPIPTSEEFSPKVVYDSHGYAVAAWLTSSTLMAAKCVGGVWGSEMAAANSSCYIALAADSFGNTHAFGSYYSGGSFQYGAYNGNVWGSSAGFGSLTNPTYDSISASTSGDVIALYGADAGGLHHVYYVKKPAGDVWGSAVMLDTDSTAGNNASWPTIAFDSAENAMVVWTQYNGTTADTDVWAVRYQGTAFGTPAIIDIGAGNVPSKAVVAAGKGNRQFVAWPQNDGTYLNIYCNIFNP